MLCTCKCTVGVHMSKFSQHYHKQRKLLC
jgi:hypothetical protein